MRKIVKQPTLAEQAYESVKKMIITGELKPGEELPEEKLAAELGISRTPLREALKRLAVDALIELRKTKPALVARFTHQDVKEIMELRRLLEIYGIEGLSKADQQHVLKELRYAHERQWEAIQAHDFAAFMDWDQWFHDQFYEFHPNQRLRELIHAVNTGGSRVFLLLSKKVFDSAVIAHQEHGAIIEALEQGDLEKTKKQLAVHLENIEDRLLKYISQEEL